MARLMGGNFQSVILESDYERKYKMIESIRNFATTLENVYVRIEEEQHFDG